MKKTLLLLAAALLTSVASFAQWTRPALGVDAPKGQALVKDGETIQYLYNVEAHGFLLGANDWNTRASVNDTLGYQVKVQVNDESTGDLSIIDSVQTQSDWKCMFVDNATSIWVDNNSGANATTWGVEAVEGNSFKIFNSAFDKAAYEEEGAVYGYLGTGLSGLDTRLYLTSYFDAQNITEVGYTWLSVSPEEYEAYVAAVKVAYPAYKEAMTTYTAAMSLKAALESAKTQYPDLDFSAPEAVYNNTASTAEELAAAEAQVTSIINDYKASQASFENPTDFTSIIGDGSSIDPWTREFTGSGTVGTWHLNTWSTEGQSDGTDMLTPFCEDWVANGSILSDQKIYQTLTAAAPGLYKFTADARGYSEGGGIDHFEGLKMFLGNDTIDLQSEADMFLWGSKCVLWSKDYFSVIAIVKEGGDIQLGFDIKNANWNWLAFKNTSLLYYGNKDCEENAAKLVKASYSFEEADDIDANADLKEAYTTALAAFNEATTVADVKAAAKEAAAAYTVLKANATAYETLLAKIETWRTAVTEHNDLAGESWDGFVDFMDGNEVEGYPTPTPGAIADDNDRSMLTDEIETYISTVDALYAYAIAHSMQEGSDCTAMLTNPSFANGFTGWTKSDGKSTPTGNVGGLDICKDVEVYSNVVDVQQVVEDVPAGLYSISCQAFERPAANGSYTGDEDSKVFLYMGDIQTPVMNICKDAVAEDAVENKVNCYVAAEDGATTGTGSWPYDYNVAGYGWVPNSMDGASYAFAAGRYQQKVYGIVGDDGKMTIGLTSNGVTAHWVLWANFKLTYEGKNAEAIWPVAENALENLKAYLEAANDDETIAPATIEAYQATVDDLTAEIGDEYDGDTSYEALYAAFTKCNETLAAAKASVALKAEFQTAYDAFQSAYSDYSDTADPEVAAQAESLTEEIDNAIDEASDEDLKTWIPKMEEYTTKLKVPAHDDASAENPVDMTQVITNASYDNNDNTGWSGSTPGFQTYGNAEFYNTTYDYNQTIKGLPAGWYKLTVQGFYRRSWAGVDYGYYAAKNDTCMNANLYAVVGGDSLMAKLMPISACAFTSDSEYLPTSDGATPAKTDTLADEELIYTYVPNNMASAATWFQTENADGEYNYTATLNGSYNKIAFKLEEGQNLVIGLKKDVTINGDWTIFDNWKLEYSGSDVPTAVESLKVAPVATRTIYNLAGQRVAKAVKGIYIINGKKVVVK